MRPFFPFYGSKWRLARLYGRPEHTILVEPFAGSASYATYWAHPVVRLFDLDENIVQVWQYLLRVRVDEVLALPLIRPGEPINDLKICAEAKLLIGFWANRGSSSPKKTMTAWAARNDRAQSVWGEHAKQRIAQQLAQLGGWTITQGSYENALGYSATWFVDPPYVDKGRFYRKRFSDFEVLGSWCRSRRGQIIVCEGRGATWLPFQSLGNVKSTRGQAEEFVWYGSA